MVVSCISNNIPSFSNFTSFSKDNSKYFARLIISSSGLAVSVLGSCKLFNYIDLTNLKTGLLDQVDSTRAVIEVIPGFSTFVEKSKKSAKEKTISSVKEVFSSFAVFNVQSLCLLRWFHTANVINIGSKFILAGKIKSLLSVAVCVDSCLKGVYKLTSEENVDKKDVCLSISKNAGLAALSLFDFVCMPFGKDVYSFIAASSAFASHCHKQNN